MQRERLRLGVRRTLALRLLKQRRLTLAQAAKLAAVSTEDFMALAGAAGVDVVDYPPEELGEEVATARPRLVAKFRSMANARTASL